MRNRKNTKTENPLLQQVRNAVRLHNIEELQKLVTIMKTTPVAERKDGADLLCLVLSCKEGMDLFFADEEWRDTLTKDELNKTDYFSRNALYLLMKDDRGRRLLQDDDIFRKKITQEGFSHSSENHLAPARILISMPEGIDILTTHPDLQELISAKALNELHGDNMPMIFELAKTKKGISILFHPKLRNRISEEGLNARHMHVTTLNLLTSTQEGIVLIEDEKVCALIQSNTLNHVNREHVTPVSHLCQSSFGQEILLRNKRLAKKILPVAMTAMEAYGLTPFYHLAKSEKGISVLMKYDHLCRMMTEKVMNESCSQGNEKGVSVLLLLLTQPRGVELLCRNRGWLSLISKRGLHAHREYPDGTSVAVIDLLKKPENAAVFVLLPAEIREEVNYWHDRIALIVSKNRSALFTAPTAVSDKGKEEASNLTL